MYGQLSCTVCGATCQNVSGATAYCGDGIRQAAQEACDDGNTSCGTCNSTCQTTTGAQAATGMLFVTNGSNLADGDTFTLDDGLHVPLTFEYSFDSSVTSGNVIVMIIAGEGGSSVRSKTITAINGVAAALEITATAGPANLQINLQHDRATSLGNRPITENVFTSQFSVSGMNGGAAGDCVFGTSCRSNGDCLSGTCAGNVCQ